MAVKKIGTLNKHQNPATNENEFDIENYMNVNWDKIKEVVDNNADELTTTQGKVTTLETDNTKNKQDISDIKTEQETQNDLLQRTQSALINITTPKSSNINVKDSSNLNAKINVFGISEQDGEPSPSNIVDIENVTGDIDITVCNKNLFTGFTKGKGLNGTTGEETTNSTGAVSNFIEVGFSKNSNYYLSGLTNTLNSYIAAYNKNKEFLGRIGANAQTNISFNKDSFTLYSAEGDIAFVRVTQYEIITSTGTIDDIDDLNVQLEANNVATDFIAHEEQLITFPLQEGQRLYDGDYLASDGIHHVRKQIELNGTENIFLENSTLTNVKRFYIRNIGGYANPNYKGLCSHFKYIANYSLDEEHVYVTTAGFLYIFANFNSVDELKEYLAEQKANGTPVIVEYELETEEIEAYTEEQQKAYDQLQNAQSYYNVTNVFTDKAQLVFKYIADTQTWVLNKLNNINQQILEIAGGN